eukprot:761035-Hanusia_phi.AAC.2
MGGRERARRSYTFDRRMARNERGFAATEIRGKRNSGECRNRGEVNESEMRRRSRRSRKSSVRGRSSVELRRESALAVKSSSAGGWRGPWMGVLSSLDGCTCVWGGVQDPTGTGNAMIFTIFQLILKGTLGESFESRGTLSKSRGTEVEYPPMN